MLPVMNSHGLEGRATRRDHRKSSSRPVPACGIKARLGISIRNISKTARMAANRGSSPRTSQFAGAARRCRPGRSSPRQRQHAAVRVDSFGGRLARRFERHTIGFRRDPRAGLPGDGGLNSGRSAQGPPSARAADRRGPGDRAGPLRVDPARPCHRGTGGPHRGDADPGRRRLLGGRADLVDTRRPAVVRFRSGRRRGDRDPEPTRIGRGGWGAGRGHRAARRSAAEERGAGAGAHRDRHPQERVPGDPGPRAAQSPGPDPQRPADHEAPRAGRPRSHLGPRRRRAPVDPAQATG